MSNWHQLQRVTYSQAGVCALEPESLAGTLALDKERAGASFQVQGPQRLLWTAKLVDKQLYESHDRWLSIGLHRPLL